MATANGQQRRTQAERRQEAETGLINAAIKLITQKGFDRITLAEVGATAGYSRGLPVHYFGTKENLLIKVVEHVVASYRLGLKALPPSPNGLPRLTQIIMDYVKPSKSPAAHALGILIAQATLHAELGAEVTALNDRGLEVLEDEVRAGIALGNVRPDIDSRLVAQMIFSFLRGQASFSMLDKKFESIKVAEEFVRSLERHLSPAVENKAPKKGAGRAAPEQRVRRAPSVRQ